MDCMLNELFVLLINMLPCYTTLPKAARRQDFFFFCCTLHRLTDVRHAGVMVVACTSSHFTLITRGQLDPETMLALESPHLKRMLSVLSFRPPILQIIKRKTNNESDWIVTYLNGTTWHSVALASSCEHTHNTDTSSPHCLTKCIEH